MADSEKKLVKLAAALVKHQVKQQLGNEFLAEFAGGATELAGEPAVAKVIGLVGQGGMSERILEAFKEADACFADECKEDRLRQAIVSKPLHGLDSLQKLASTLPDNLGDQQLLNALRSRFADDWSGQLTQEQLDRASVVYRDCLDRALAAKCDQLLPTIFRKIDRVESIVGQTRGTADETLATAKRIESRLADADDAGTRDLPRIWLRPTPPLPSRDLVGRRNELEAVRALLIAPADAVRVAMYGTPGVGKTLLAEHLATQADRHFRGGVLFQRLGAGFRDPTLAQAVLIEWAAHAYGGQRPWASDELTPAAVRALLASHGSVLIVLDDVWERRAIEPLLDALPPEARLLVTTRSERTAMELYGGTYELGLLPPDEARELLQARVRRAMASDGPVLDELAKVLGYHPLALEVAGGSLSRLAPQRWPAAVMEIAKQVRGGSGFGELRLSDDETGESRVEAALSFSYADLTRRAKERFRLLGAFAPDPTFSTEAVAGVWSCSTDDAEGQLTVFTERRLLTRLENDNGSARWLQHSLLRAYALALLRRAGDEEVGRTRHARTYSERMRKADEQQAYSELLPEYPQLRHAFDWAIEHDLDLAHRLGAHTSDLQASFNLVPDNHGWAVRLVDATKQSGDDALRGAVLGNLANSLLRMARSPGEDRGRRLRQALETFHEAKDYSRPEVAPLEYATILNNQAAVLRELATLPGEDRGTRLREALAAYDVALEYRRARVAPLAYAGTQNNRSVVLRELADVLGEDRGTRLHEGLEAADEALRFYRPEVVPLDYAGAQNNRANLLVNLADLVGEDRASRLCEALGAFEAALRYRQPEAAPLAYALTQNNRGNVFLELAALPSENRGDRLRESLQAFDAALVHQPAEVAPLDRAMTQHNRANVLREL